MSNYSDRNLETLDCQIINNLGRRPNTTLIEPSNAVMRCDGECLPVSS